MLLIKRLFRRTVKSIKALLSSSGGGEASYQRLPKTPPPEPLKRDQTLASSSSTAQYTSSRSNNNNSSSSRGDRMLLVARRLKELEAVDKANIDHLLDIQEVYQCYSRLSCPAYLHIVDAFFMDLYADFIHS